jgi:CBS domain-containing protein
VGYSRSNQRNSHEIAVPKTVGSILRQKGNDVWSVSPDATVYDAIEMMARKRIGALIVLDGPTLVGIISERDYTRKVILQGRASKETAVREIMTAPVQSVTPNRTVDEAMRIMSAGQIRHLPVVDGSRVVGVVSIGDLVRKLLSTQGEMIRHLQEYITGRKHP